jgi:cephalosporin hydroxylase
MQLGCATLQFLISVWRREQVWMDYKTANGWIKDEEREYLYNAAKMCDSSILNIGVEKGASVVCLHEGNPQVLIDALDIDLSTMEQDVQYLVNGGNVLFYEENSHTFDFAKQIGDIYGLIFIDGDHSYEGVKADIENIMPFLEKGGTIIFHDCYDYIDTSIVHQLCPGVNQAVEEWYSKNSADFIEQKSVGTMRIFKGR